MGVQEFRNTLRLQQAKELLVTTRIPVAVVAREVGCNDPANFSRFFSRNIGCSPRQFRTTFSGSSILAGGTPMDIAGADDPSDRHRSQASA